MTTMEDRIFAKLDSMDDKLTDLHASTAVLRDRSQTHETEILALRATQAKHGEAIARTRGIAAILGALASAALAFFIEGAKNIFGSGAPHH